MLLDFGGKLEHHAQCYAVDGYLGGVLAHTTHNEFAPHDCPKADTHDTVGWASHCVMAVRFGPLVLCEFVVCGGVLPFVLPPLLLQAQLQVFHSVSNSAMLLCRGLLCTVHFPPYFFTVYRYVFPQCSGFRLPTPTSPTSVRGGCVCVFPSLSAFFA